MSNAYYASVSRLIRQGCLKDKIIVCFRNYLYSSIWKIGFVFFQYVNIVRKKAIILKVQTESNIDIFSKVLAAIAVNLWIKLLLIARGMKVKVVNIENVLPR